MLEVNEVELKALAPVLAEMTLEDGEVLRARGGLCFREGNGAPLFIITYERIDPNGQWHGGVFPESLLDVFPEFEDLRRLELCDIEGEPLDSVRNGWFWLGFENPQQPFDPEAVAQFFRISIKEAFDLYEEIVEAMVDKADTVPNERARRLFKDWIEKQRPRWKADAQSVITAHDLTVFGDPWTRPESYAYKAA